MSGVPVSQVQRQVARASRRLFVQTLLDHLVWCWAAALLTASLWFLVQPLVIRTPEPWVRWAVAGGAFLLATGIAVRLANRRAPSKIESALELDQRFQLKERAVTSLTLAPELSQSQAGQALTADAEGHVAKVNVSQAFPLRIRWSAVAVPAGAIVLALVAIFYNPVFNSSDAIAADTKIANPQKIAEAADKVKQPSSVKLPKEERSKELEDIDKLRDEIFKKAFDPSSKDNVREQLQKMVPLEEKIKNRLEDLKAQEERNKAMASKLKDAGKDPEKQLSEDGPAKKLENALNAGDLNKAQQELKDLAEKLKQNQLTPEEQKQLEKQLSEIQKMLDDIADLKDLKDKLAKDFKAGNLSKEDFDKLLAGTLEDAKLLENLKDISDQLGDSKKLLVKGDLKDAADKLDAIAKGMKDLDPDGQEMLLLQEQLGNLQGLRMAMQDGLGGGGPPGGGRPTAEEGKTGSVAQKQQGNLDSKTQFRITGERKGVAFNKIPQGDVGGAFQKAQQDAPGAIERQQMPQDAADAIRGYFKNIGGGQ